MNRYPAPPMWLIGLLLGAACVLALTGCIDPEQDYRPNVPADAVIVYRCPRDVGSPYAREVTSVDIYRAQDGRQWAAYPGHDQVDPLAPDMRPQDACVA